MSSIIKANLASLTQRMAKYLAPSGRATLYSSQPVTFVTVCVSPICVMASTVGVVVE